MRRPRTALAATGALAIAVGLAGCGGSSTPGSKAADRHPAPSTTLASPAAPAGARSTGAPPASADDSRSAAPPAGTTPSAAGGSHPTGSTGTVPASVGPGGPPTTSAPSTSPADRLTLPGHYTYRTSGSAQTPFGKQDLNGSSTLTADPPSGDRQHTVLAGPDGTTEQVVQSRTDGLYLADLKISMQGFNEDFRPTAPVLFLPRPATTGRTWSWQITSTDGKYTVHGTFKITGQQAVAVGSEQVPCTVVDAVLAISGGGLSFTVHQTDWASATRALIVKEHAVTDGTGFGAKFHSDVTRVLTSTHPS